VEPPPPPADAKERHIDVLFVGSFIDYQKAREEWLAFPRSIVSVFEGILDCMLADETRGLEEAARCVLEGLGFYPNSKEFYRFFTHLHLVDRFVRGYRRHQCLDILARSGLRVECYGNWMEAKLDAGKKFTIKPPIDMTETLAIVRQAKIVLNVLPGYIDGAHERIFTAMLGGAACVSDRSRFLEEEFVDGQDILLYSHRNSGVLPEVLNTLIATPRKLREVAQNGREKTLHSHTWLERAKRLLTITETQKLLAMNDKNLPF